MSNYLFSSFKSSAAAAASTTQPPPPPGVAATSAQRSTSDIYWPESATHRYLSSSQDFSSKYLSGSEILRYYSTPSSRLVGGGGGAPATSYLGSDASLWNGLGYGSSGVKRAAAADSIYHPSVLGAQNTSGQYEAWYTGNSLDKRPRLENASKLPIYPQRPGEKDCVYYMQTRTCKFGDSCKFDHPIWVPEGGIPDWKELPPASEILPERPGEPDCPYFLKTTKCKFGMNCKFNHPKNEVIDVGASENNTAELPQRSTETPCAFYMKTGTCKFGASCKFHHPKDIHIPPAGQENGIGDQIKSTSQTNGAAGDSKPANSHPVVIPAIGHNSKGLPMRMGAEDCPFYMKTGSCKYGVSCRYNHPERNVLSPPVGAIGNPFVSSSTPSLNIGLLNPAASIYRNMDPGFTQPMLEVGMTIYPQRPGQTECDYYMKTGLCKFGDACRFHHPIDRSAPLANPGQLGVKLTPAGLPRREGVAICAYYLKTCTCKFGAACKFDHPPPGEVLAMAALQAASSGEEVKGNEKDAQTDQENQK